MNSVTPIEDRLRQALAFVDGHVKFAETKNAALLAADAALAIAVGQVLLGEHPVARWLALYLLGILVTAIVSAVVALLSFLPVTQIPWLRRHRKRERVGNLMFFGDIQRHDGLSYVTALADAAGEPCYQVSELELMYGEQVVINAKIAGRKFTYFRYAIWLMLAGLLTVPIAGALLWYVADRNL